MIAGQVAGVDPEAWKIVDGKLYLGYSKARMKAWENKPVAAVKHDIAQADSHWAKIQHRD